MSPEAGDTYSGTEGRMLYGSEGISDVGAFMQGRLASARIVTLPQSFQPRGETFTDHDFVSPIIADRTFQEDWHGPVKELPVVLVSLGTAYNNRPEFFRMVAESARGRPWHVVMAVGEQVDMDDLGELPHNVEAHPRVPQMAEQRADADRIRDLGLGLGEALVPQAITPDALWGRDRPRRVRFADHAAARRHERRDQCLRWSEGGRGCRGAVHRAGVRDS